MARRGGDVVEYLDAHAWIASHDQGHFPDAGLTVSEHGECAVLAGQPLLAPAGQDRAALFKAMASANGPALAPARGQFAAALWSSRDRVLRLCTDSQAIYPLYVAISQAGAVFATTMRTMRALATSALRIDERALADMVHFRFLTGVRTIHEGVRIVGAGELLEISIARQQSLQYFDWAQIEPASMDRDEAIEALHACFAEAIMLRLPGAPTEATLSGGMDSRAVVAGLVDLGHRPCTWTLSYPGSADHVLSHMVAQAMGVEHHGLAYTPAERLHHQDIPLGSRFRQHWVATGRYGPSAPVRLWTGHGAGRGLGNNFPDPPDVAAGAEPPSPEQAVRLFPNLGKRGPRLIKPRRYRQLRALAIDNVIGECERCGRAPAQRRLWMLHLLNHGCRQTHWYREASDLTGVELLMPMYDGTFLRLISTLPIDWFTGHALYNDWITRFRTPAASVAWQSYPGHLPSPVPMPTNVRLQWEREWYRSKDVRQVVAQAAAFALDRADPRLADWIEPWVARLALAGLRLGNDRLEHELTLLRNLHRGVTGEDAFARALRDAWVEPRVRRMAASPHGSAADAPAHTSVAA